jgi:hypothetical protein
MQSAGIEAWDQQPLPLPAGEVDIPRFGVWTQRANCMPALLSETSFIIRYYSSETTPTLPLLITILLPLR